MDALNFMKKRDHTFKFLYFEANYLIMRKPVYVCLLSFMALFSCSEQTPDSEKNLVEENEIETTTDEVDHEDISDPDPIATPKGYEVIGEADGDLNKDGSLEKVIVYNTSREGDMGSERELCIYKVENNQWKIWFKSTSAVLSSESGGMMGDPFESVAIEKGCIVLNHFGGSREKWNYTHRFRYQDDFFHLIGATSIFGAPCDYWEEFDYNLSNGQATYKTESESCDDEGGNPVTTVTADEKFTKKLSSLPAIASFSPGANKITIPGNNSVFYY
ncbi:MAG: hypothetical protein ACI837_003478 [Crocinitomicaceae bacterium]|jgi:hypothetical protein